MRFISFFRNLFLLWFILPPPWIIKPLFPTGCKNIQIKAKAEAEYQKIKYIMKRRTLEDCETEAIVSGRPYESVQWVSKNMNK
jgi:hypothetical protein